MQKKKNMKSGSAQLMEGLEERRLMSHALGDFIYGGFLPITERIVRGSSEANVTGEKIYITGTSQDDTVTISHSAKRARTSLTVTDSRGTWTKLFADATHNILGYDVDLGGGSNNILNINNPFSYPTGQNVQHTHVDLPHMAGGTGQPTPSEPVTETLTTEQGNREAELIGANASKYDYWFFGDSYAQFFQNPTLEDGSGNHGDKVWNGDSSAGGVHWDRKSLDLGVAGATTSNMLDQIRNHPAFSKTSLMTQGHAPKDVFVFAGTNEFTHPAVSGDDKQIAAGIEEVVTELRTRLDEAFPNPSTPINIVLLSVLPLRGLGANNHIENVNGMLSKFQRDNASTIPFRFDPLYKYFVHPTDHLGVLDTMYYGEHPSQAGYQKISSDFFNHLTAPEKTALI